MSSRRLAFLVVRPQRKRVSEPRKSPNWPVYAIIPTIPPDTKQGPTYEGTEVHRKG